jgi:putative ABC transport system permease protein
MHDLRYAIRTLRRSPTFAAVAILTLALGIGATTAIYSVVDTILLQPLPFPDSDRLVRIVENFPHVVPGRAPLQRGVTHVEFLEWRGRTRTLEEMAVVAGMGQRVVRTPDGTARLWGGGTSPEIFAMLGTQALLGRTLGPHDAANPDVVVLSHDTWQRLFRADPALVGKTIELRSPEPMFRNSPQGVRLLTIVGVMPPAFEFPTGALDFYTPLALPEAARRALPLTLIGRLRAGVSLDAAVDEANVLGNAIKPPPPANAPPLTIRRFEVQRLKDRLVQGLRPALRVFLAAVAVVLLIVCANVASLLLARGTARQREIAVRLAIGASRARVMRQVFAECVVLAAAGGALGALLGAGGVWLVKTMAAVDAPGIFRLSFGTSILPRGHEVGVDLRMFGIAFAIAAITSIAFGLLPAFHLSRTDHLHALGARGSGFGRGAARLRAALVVGQLVMATTLLVGAGLLARSFIVLSTVERGYDPAQVLAFQLVFPADYSIARKTGTIDALLTRLRATPQVRSAGFTRAGILIGEELFIGTFVPPGRTLEEMRAESTRPRVRAVSSGYLTAMGVPILGGREFDDTDVPSAIPGIVINRSVARRYFATAEAVALQGAVGQVVEWHMDKSTPVQVRVLGVVEDIRNESPEREAFPEIFVEYRQLLALQERWGHPEQRQNELAIGFLSFAVRTAGDPASLIPAVSRIVRGVDANAGFDAIIPMERLVASSVARQRFYAVLLGVFAAIAGVLAAVGVYGVLAYAVTQRTQEIGIRMALGAQRRQVLGLVLRSGLVLTTIGIALGLLVAAAGSRLLQGMLFGITALDTQPFIAVSATFGLVAMLAAYVPARRATAVDPAVTLRRE